MNVFLIIHLLLTLPVYLIALYKMVAGGDHDFFSSALFAFTIIIGIFSFVQEVWG